MNKKHQPEKQNHAKESAMGTRGVSRPMSEMKMQGNAHDHDSSEGEYQQDKQHHDMSMQQMLQMHEHFDPPGCMAYKAVFEKRDRYENIVEVHLN